MHAVLPLCLVLACNNTPEPQPEIRIVSPTELQAIDGEYLQIEVEVANVRLVPPPESARRTPPSALARWLIVRAHAQDSDEEEEEEEEVEEALFDDWADWRPPTAFIEVRIAGALGPRTDQRTIEAPLLNLVDGTHNLDARLMNVDPGSSNRWPRRLASDTVRFVRQLAQD